MKTRSIVCITIAALAASAFVTADADAQRRRRRAPAEEPEPAPEPDVEADAEPSERDVRARQHFEAGRSYFESSRYEDAAREFMESYQLSRRGALLVNVASARERSLDHRGAIAALETLRDEHPDVMAADEIERRIAYLGRAADAQAAADAAAAEAAATPPPPPAEDPTLAILGWSLTGVGAGGLVAGGVMAGLTYDANEQFERAERVADQLTLADEVRERALVADVLFVAGGAIAAGGVIVLVVDALDGEDEADPEAATVTVGPRFGRGGGGLDVSGRF